MNTLILKKPIESKKFGVIFPAGVPLEYEILDNSYYVKHPNLGNILTYVKRKNISNADDSLNLVVNFVKKHPQSVGKLLYETLMAGLSYDEIEEKLKVLFL